MRSLIRYFQVTLGVLSGPGVIFFLPFIIPVDRYSGFMGFLAISQLFSLFGSGGLEVVGARNAVNPFRIIKVLVIIHAAILAVSLVLLKEPPMIATISMVSALGANAGIVMQNYLLFMGKSREYAFSSLIRAVVLIAGVMVAVASNATLAKSWAILNIAGAAFPFLFVIRVLRHQTNSDHVHSVLALMKSGSAMFIINASATLPFVFDRVMAKNGLATDIFSQYMVATSWAIPVVYLGNTAQQFIIASNPVIDKKIVQKSILFLSLKYGCYASVIFLVTRWYVPPYFHTSSEFLKIWGAIFTWQALYSSLAFPISAAIQRGLSNKYLVNIRNFSIIFVLIFFGGYFLSEYIGLKLSSRYEVVAASSCLALFMIFSRYYVLRNWLKSSEAT